MFIIEPRDLLGKDIYILNDSNFSDILFISKKEVININVRLTIDPDDECIAISYNYNNRKKETFVRLDKFNINWFFDRSLATSKTESFKNLIKKKNYEIESYKKKIEEIEDEYREKIINLRNKKY